MHSNSNKKNQILVNLLRLIIFTKLDMEKVKSQGEKFLKDVKTFESAILLWAKEEYPDYMIFISAFIGPVFLQVSSSMLPGMKKVVDEYFAFIDEVKAKNIELYNEELGKSHEMFFQKTIQPMDLLVAKDPFIKKVNQNLIGILNILKPQIQEYSERILPIMKSAGEKIKAEGEKIPKVEDLNQVVDKINSSKGFFTKLFESLNDFKALGEELNKFPQELRKIMEDTKIKTKQLQSETLPDLPKLSEDFKNTAKDFKEIYDPNDPAWAYKRLGLVKDIDSFHIEFIKFMARLYHILSCNNRNYNREYPQILIKPRKHYPETRSKLKKFLKREMSVKYPKLSEYLLSMFEYNKYRKIEAHENPRVRIENGVAYFSVKGTDKEVEMNLVETLKIHRTYTFFIKALNLGD